MRLLIIIALLAIVGYFLWTVFSPELEKLIKDKENKEQLVNE